ncbi:MAG: hypothetical protein LBV09_00430, partial [Deferribacteraceae bacterium]|nr:hypothetical protein [Deferribacteraceae bacterium]
SCKYVYDLAELWYQHTGLPFVFSLWLIPTASKDKPAVRMLYSELAKIVSKVYNQGEFYATEFLKRFPDSFKREQLVEYWQHIYYNISDEEIAGLKLYYKLSGYEGELLWFD